MGEKTLEVSVDKFVELCKIDARMETLKAYIEKAEKKGGFVELDTIPPCDFRRLWMVHGRRNTG